MKESFAIPLQTHKFIIVFPPFSDPRQAKMIVRECNMHPPGVEPGARPWEDPMLPLHHECHNPCEVMITYMLS